MNDRIKPAVAWVKGPVEPVMPLIPILSPKPGIDVWCFVTSTELVGVITHYLHGRTKPCTGIAESCEGCISGRPKREKYYVAAVQPPLMRHVLAEITSEAYRGCREIQGPQAKLYGKRLILHRMGKSPNSRVEARLEEMPTPQAVGQPFDVEAALMRIWFGDRWENVRKRAAEQRDQIRSIVQRFQPPESIGE